MLRPGHGGSGASCNVRTAAPAAAHAADDAVDGSPRWPSAAPGRAASASAGGLRHRSAGSGDRSQAHRLDLDIEASLISVDLHEHIADAQGRPFVMGDDDFHLLSRGEPDPVHVRHHRSRTGDVVEGFGSD